MIRLFILTLICCTVVCHPFLYAGTIPFAYDIVQFKGDSIHTVVELQYIYADNILKIKKDGNRQIKELSLECTVSNTTGIVATRSKISESIVIQDTLPHEYAGIVQFALKPGQYSLKIKLADINNPATSDVVNSTLIVKQIVSTSPQLSDVLVASSIQSATINERGSQFERNGLLVTPLPTLEYIGSESQLQTYCECMAYKK